MQPVALRLHPVSLLLLGVGLMYIIVTRHGSAVPPIAAVRQPMPSITVQDATGMPVTTDDLRGRPVIYVLWASWCPPCRAELPVLQAMSPQLSESGVQLVLVNQGESTDVVVPWLSAQQISLTPWLDTQSVFATAFQAHDLPSAIFVNANGNVDLIYRGPVTHDIVTAMLLTWQQQSGAP